MTPRSESPRLAGLDALRGVSILLVMMCHSGWTQLLPKRLGDFVFRVTYPAGMFGVPIFFVISGFLITYLLVREEERTGTISLKTFWLRRALRILPPLMLYGALMLAYAQLAGIWFESRDLVAVACFFRNVVSGNALFDHFWSLSIEEQFYSLWPLAFLVLNPRWRAWGVIGALVAAPILRIAGVFVLSEPHYNLMTRALRFDSILIGCLVALHWASWQRSGWLRERGGILACVGLTLGALSWVMALAGDVFALAPGELNLPNRLLIELVTLTGNFGITLILAVLVADGTRLGRALSRSWLARIGVISYSLYLWQQFFYFAPHLPEWLASPVVRTLGALGAALGSYALVERPLMPLRRRLSAGRPA